MVSQGAHTSEQTRRRAPSPPVRLGVALALFLAAAVVWLSRVQPLSTSAPSSATDTPEQAARRFPTGDSPAVSSEGPRASAPLLSWQAPARDHPGTAPAPLPPSELAVTTSSASATDFAFTLGDLTIETDTHDGRPVSVVRAGGSHLLKHLGQPSLPVFRSDVIIPADTAPEIEILAATFVDIPSHPPKPSAGFRSRDAGAAGPAPFGSAYSRGSRFPATPVRLTAPYMVRSIRAVGVLVSPCQYLADSGVLRVYSSLQLRLHTPPVDNHEPAFPPAPRSRVFRTLAARRYANADLALRATSAVAPASDSENDPGRSGTTGPPDQAESLLLVIPTGWEHAASTFVQWKRQRGMRVAVARFPEDTGSTPAALAAFVSAAYAQEQLTHLILMGDHTDIPPRTSSPIPSDTDYSLVSGDDYYHDLFVSRVSIPNPETLGVFLQRLVDYEKTPAPGNWFERGMMIGSNQNNGDLGRKDRDVLAAERLKLLQSGYSTITEVYDPGAGVTPVINAWNVGLSLIYYLGHGGSSTWTTTGFGNTHAYALNNGMALPFVIHGACYTGDFVNSSSDCLAEALMKTGSAASPAGASGSIAATTAMDWDPPIVMIEAFTGYITAADSFSAGGMFFSDQAPLFTAGGMTFASIQRAMDFCYATPGEGVGPAQKIMHQTHLFGDCTLGLRTRSPASLSVSHPAVIIPGEAFSATVLQAPDNLPLAGAAVSLWSEDSLRLLGFTDAAGQVSLAIPFQEPGNATLTVYERNAIPYQATLPLNGDTLLLTEPASPLRLAVAQEVQIACNAVGGTPPYTWELQGGSVPGLTLGTDGILAGIPSQTGQVTVTLHAMDSQDPPREGTTTLVIHVGAPVTLSEALLPQGTVNTPYQTEVTAEGDFSPFHFALSSGTLPPGLTFQENGTLQGTPTVAGTFSISITCTDQFGAVSQRSMELHIDPSDTVEILALDLPVGLRLQPYAAAFAATGGSGSGYAWRLAAGVLPEGIALSSSGALTGTPSQFGVFAFSVAVEDNSLPPREATAACELTIESPVFFTAATLPNATLGSAYSTPAPVAGSHHPIHITLPPVDHYTLIEDAQSTFAEGGTLQETWKAPSFQSEGMEWTLELGFEFPFFDSLYSSCRVGDNGYIVFGQGSPNPRWKAVSEALETCVMIAPFWSDLVITDAHESTGIWVERTADSVSIRWRALDYHYVEGTSSVGGEEPTPDWVNACLTLHRSGHIQIAYGRIQTSNRIIVGIGGGPGITPRVLLAHSWNNLAPQYLEGWSNHPDMTLNRPSLLPDWLTLTANGELVGTPSQLGRTTLSLMATDAHGYQAQGDLTLDVDAPPADADGDGTISNSEILAFIELWHAGGVSEEIAADAVALWRAGGNPSPAATRTSLRHQDDSGSGVPLVGLPDVTAHVPCHDRAELDRLIDTGVIVSAVLPDGTAVISATQDMITHLQALGFTVLLQPSASAEDRGGYHTYDTLSAELIGLHLQYPDLCYLQSIGQSVQGRELWALKISANPQIDEAEPELRLCGTIHGDEPPGMELLLRLANHLLLQYGAATTEGERVTSLLDSSEIWILPLLNPDGLEAETRVNANGIDLNRDFPDGAISDIGTLFSGAPLQDNSVQPETAALMRWSAGRSFTAALGYHTGILLVCYPYGNNPAGLSLDSPTPDDALFRQLAHGYAELHPTMPLVFNPPGGVINAAAWYRAVGEMPDWSYRYLGTLELTVETSIVKAPYHTFMDSMWWDNQDAFFRWASLACRGLHGQVVDADGGHPLWAEIRVQGNAQPAWSDPRLGDFHRPLPPGTYSITVNAPGYQEQTITPVSVSADGSDPFLQVELSRATPHQARRTFGRLRYLPETGNTVTIRVELAPESMPAACIVSEHLPEGWTYVPQSTRDSRNPAQEEPRLDGNTASWLFWRELPAVFSFAYSAEATSIPRSASAHFDGTLAWHGDSTASNGDSVWLPAIERQVTYELEPGWNLISLPVCPTSEDVQRTLGETTFWTWDGGSYRKAESLESKRGYWTYDSGRNTLQIRGWEEEERTQVFQAGWNLFGPLTQQAPMQGTPFAGPAWEWQGALRPATILLPGVGYWVFCNTQTEVKLR